MFYPGKVYYCRPVFTCCYYTEFVVFEGVLYVICIAIQLVDNSFVIGIVYLQHSLFLHGFQHGTEVLYIFRVFEWVTIAMYIKPYESAFVI